MQKMRASIRVTRQPILWVALLIIPAQVTAVSCFAENPLPANELGKVMILEYHLIRADEGRWARSPGHFKADLDLLWRSDYRPIGISDYIDGRIGLPAGKKPVILTFDDSSPGQFRYLVKNGVAQLDPDCAVAILLEFHARHPDFPLKAVFYVLPAAQEPHKLFGQPEFEGEKLRELVQWGFEIGNHTLWHARLDKYEDSIVVKQLALAQEAIGKSVPRYILRSLSLPLGMYPANLQLATQGTYHGITYHHDALLTVAGPPAPSPFSTTRELTRLPRIQVPGSDFTYWLRYFERHPDDVYRSDGAADQISFPKVLAAKFNRDRFPGLKVLEIP